MTGATGVPAVLVVQAETSASTITPRRGGRDLATHVIVPSRGAELIHHGAPLPCGVVNVSEEACGVPAFLRRVKGGFQRFLERPATVDLLHYEKVLKSIAWRDSRV